MKSTNHLTIYLYLLSAVLAALCSSCFTGIESTKRIELSREDKKSLQPTAEDILVETIHPLPLSEWQTGKNFVCADNKVALTFIQEGLPTDINILALKGKVLTYRSVEEIRSPDSSSEAVIIFSDGKNLYRYRTGKSPDNAGKEVISSDLPMLIDADMVKGMDSLLEGKQLWIKSPVWLDDNDEKVKGRKFVPVTVTSVIPGNIAFPFKINFTSEDGKTASVYANYNNPGNIRSFSSLFSLTDPHSLYNSISNETWALIQEGKIAEGMTKEECRLSIGNPGEIDRGHTWDETRDYWGYPDGSYIWFKDGLVVSFRKI